MHLFSNSNSCWKFWPNSIPDLTSKLFWAVGYWCSQERVLKYARCCRLFNDHRYCKFIWLVVPVKEVWKYASVFVEVMKFGWSCGTFTCVGWQVTLIPYGKWRPVALRLVSIKSCMNDPVQLLPPPPLSEWRRYCGTWHPHMCVCVYRAATARGISLSCVDNVLYPVLCSFVLLLKWFAGCFGIVRRNKKVSGSGGWVWTTVSSGSTYTQYIQKGVVICVWVNLYVIICCSWFYQHTSYVN